MRVKKAQPWSNLDFFFFIFAILGIAISAWSVIKGTIAFHTDIARDFLLLQDLVDKGDFSLIGPRAGGIQGLFHGPLWMYIHAPIYFIGHGNPVIIGWFWVFLVMCTAGIIGWVGKKLFGRTEGLAAMALFTSSMFDVTSGLYNPFGAVIVAPLFFYCLISYLRTNKISYLLFTYFFIGILIQFEIAFGAPMLLLTLVITTRNILKTHHHKHALAYCSILLPLSTYIMFDLRNNFLQTQSVISFILQPKPSDLAIAQQVWIYLKAIYNGVIILKGPLVIFSAPLAWLATYWIFQKNKKKKIENIDAYVLFAYLYVGFWLLALLFRGNLQSYYSWPFITFAFLIFGSLMKLMNKKLWMMLISLILIWHTSLGLLDTQKVNASMFTSGSSWTTSYDMAFTIFSSTKEDFGYFIYSPELFGYSPRYAMDFVQKEFLHKAVPFEKRRTTYLIIIPPKINGVEKDVDWWKTHEVHIATSGASIKRIGDYIIEKHTLSDKEIAIPANPNLIQGIYFR